MLTNSKSILNQIDQFDQNYKIINKQYNCFTNNLSDFARSYIDEQSAGLLSGKLIAIKDNINIKEYPTTCCSKIIWIIFISIGELCSSRMYSNGNYIISINFF